MENSNKLQEKLDKEAEKKLNEDIDKLLKPILDTQYIYTTNVNIYIENKEATQSQSPKIAVNFRNMIKDVRSILFEANIEYYKEKITNEFISRVNNLQNELDNLKAIGNKYNNFIE